MRSNNRTRSFVVAIVALASALVLAAPAPADNGCSSLSGVLTGWIGDGPQGITWYGVAYLSIGGAPVVRADYVDLNAGYDRMHWKNNGSLNFAGDEVLTFRVASGDSFQLQAHFSAVCFAPASYGCELHETATFVPEAGTGLFAGMTGHASIQGPFAGGDCGPSQPCYWIGRMNGAVCTQ
ncbi:MAG: hypothetical protein IPL90_07335 [Holophagales bacterium]|nr:hypothetical protein [Holophagales bacterium]